MDDSILECPICIEQFEDPVMLPCQHCFCWNCISNYVRKSDSICPICRSRFKENELKRNLILEQILENKNPSVSRKPKPSDEGFPRNFNLAGPSGRQQQVQEQTNDNLAVGLLAGAAGLLIGVVGAAIGMKLSSNNRRRR